MLKRFGILALLLSTSAVVIPMTAFAEDGSHREARYAYSGDRRDARERPEYRTEFRRDDRDREKRDHERVRTYFAPAPNYYYTPAPYCAR
jgi:hypothetical protein